MLTNNGITANGIRFIGGGSASVSVDSRQRVGWSMANRVAFSQTTSFPVGYYQNALKLPFSVGEIGSTNRTFGLASAESSIFGIGSIDATLDLNNLITTTGFLIQGIVKSGVANGIGTFEPFSLAGKGVIAATLNIGFKPSAFDIAQEVWGAIASLNNVIGTMGEVLNSAASGSGGGGASASSIASAVWDRLLSNHQIAGSAGKALSDAGGGSSPSVIASAVRTELSTELSRIDASTSSRLASTSYIAPDNSTISTINTKLGTPSISISADIATRASQSSVNAIPTTTLLTTDLRLNNLDAPISSRLATTSYSAPISASAISSQVRAELSTELARIDTTISSRNATTPPTVAQIRTELDTNSTKLDVSVSTRLAGLSYTVPPTASQVASQVRTELTTELGRIDTAISTRLSSASYVSPDNLTISTINTKLGTPVISISSDIATRASQASLDAIPTNTLLSSDSRLNNLDASISSRLATSGYSAPISATTIANAVWTAVTRSLNTDVTLSSSQITAIATGVEAAILNETDGQQVVNAIVQAIGNTNITSGAIASAVRTELATELSRIDVATSTRLASSNYTPPNNSGIASILEDTNELQTNQTQWVTATGFATPSNVSNAQTAIINEINANEIKLDSIKAKTDVLVNTDLSDIEADLLIINEGVKKASLLVPHSEDL
ncbi:hypothetical protein [Pseudanabaena phage PA-SR01]|nr:hypothetical protein [Pseudanabaena phage PA-SR01]